jgi:hypothetical protein
MDSVSTEARGGACGFLSAEQRQVEEAFRRHEKAEGARLRQAAVEECLEAAELVLALEEQLFCPAVRRALGARRGTAPLMADAEAARRMIARLKELPAGERFDAEFSRLKGGLIRRFSGEREVLFPQAEGSTLDLERLEDEMSEYKARFLAARREGLVRRCRKALSALLP